MARAMIGDSMLEQFETTEPIEDIIGLQSDFLGSKSMAVRKTLGQFFTGSIVSTYMATLINKPKSKTIRILDAGAGTGILAASTALRCLDLGRKTVHAVLYELDSEAEPNLEQTLKVIQTTFSQQRGTFSFEIRCEDFVLANPDRDQGTQAFDISVINPPYFKYSVKGSLYAKATSDLYHGDPNIYASFSAVVTDCMKDRGQLEEAFKDCTVGIVCVTAFPDRAKFRRNAADIAWKTEEWIADNSDYMIHFNGDLFLGPHNREDQ